jgi:hypothetical protein
VELAPTVTRQNSTEKAAFTRFEAQRTGVSSTCGASAFSRINRTVWSSIAIPYINNLRRSQDKTEYVPVLQMAGVAPYRLPEKVPEK